MGGYNSGGHNRKGRLTVEQCSRLRVSDLKSAGLLKPGIRGTGSIGDTVFLEICSNKLRLRHTAGGEQSILIERHLRPFGGFQAYLICPYCGGRFTSLFLRRGSLGCRQCCRLSYQSQRLRSYDRLLRKACKAEAFLLGVSPENCVGMDAPPKPKGMRWETYSRLIQPILEASDRFSIEAARRFGV